MGFVIEPNGAREMALRTPSLVRVESPAAPLSDVSAKTASAPSRVQLAFAGGSHPSWNASPDGSSRRMAHVLPFPPGRCEVKSRCLPSGVKRGLELSVLGLVKRV